ncbi:MAG: hypothetical protein J2P53_12880 [Bradyrhizobiaceae bacterium]|nr:hypothetical protein [Bradyrhizobiaceae bacterium]
MTGRAANHDRLKALAGRLDELAPVNRAMGLGRVPVTAARILRECDKAELLGDHLIVVGTNALFAYEAAARVQIERGSWRQATSTCSMMRVVTSAWPFRTSTRAPDRCAPRRNTSFAPVRSGSIRAANRDGYLVDLIRPLARDPLRDPSRRALTDVPEDL